MKIEVDGNIIYDAESNSVVGYVDETNRIVPTSSTFTQHLATGAVSSNIEDRTNNTPFQNFMDSVGTAIHWATTPTSLAPTNAMRLVSDAYIPNTPATPQPYTLSDSDKETLAYTLLGEARGDGVRGMLAVANVIDNRTKSGQYPNNPVAVATEHSPGGVYQFSTWGAETAQGGGNQTATRREVPVGSALYKQALGIVNHVFVIGDMPDITGGAVQYHESSITPYWASSAETAYGTLTIGHQTFYPTHPVPPMNIPDVATMLDIGPADVATIPGLVVAGNLDLNNRPQVMTPEGDWATVRTIGIEENGLEVVIPTVTHDGRLLTDAQAIDYYHQTGEHLGKFTNAWLADSYAQQVHEEQAKNIFPLPIPRPGVLGDAAIAAVTERWGGEPDMGAMSVTSTLGWVDGGPDKASSIFRYNPDQSVYAAAYQASFNASMTGSAVDERVYGLLDNSGRLFDSVGNDAGWGQFTRDLGIPLPKPAPLTPPPNSGPPAPATVRMSQGSLEVHAPNPEPATAPGNTRLAYIGANGAVIGGNHQSSVSRATNAQTAVEPIEVPVRVTPEGIPVYQRPTVKVDANGIPITSTPQTWITAAPVNIGSEIGQPTPGYRTSLNNGWQINWGTTSITAPAKPTAKPAPPIPSQVLVPQPAIKASGAATSGSGVTGQGGTLKTVPTPPGSLQKPGGGTLAPTLPASSRPQVNINGVDANAPPSSRATIEAIKDRDLLVPSPIKTTPGPSPAQVKTVTTWITNPAYTSWVSQYASAGAGVSQSGSSVSRGTMGAVANVGAAAEPTARDLVAARKDADGGPGNYVPPPPPRVIPVTKKVTIAAPRPPATIAPTHSVVVQPQQPAQAMRYTDNRGRPLVAVQTSRYDPDTGRFVPYTRYQPTSGDVTSGDGMTATQRFLSDRGVDSSNMTAGQEQNAMNKALGGSSERGSFGV